MIQLKPHQIEALEKMHNGCILCGGTGSGKSITALQYYLNLKETRPLLKLYVITTARKRDSCEWEADAIKLRMKIKPIVDSWNNIEKYIDVKDAFFIFDEQRVVGSGTWARAFLKITKSNLWIMASATPGDNWMDYVTIFIANGFYKYRYEFIKRHVVQNPYVRFFSVQRYLEEDYLQRLLDDILVMMPFERETVQHDKEIICGYNKDEYNMAVKERTDPDTGDMIDNASALCYTLRKIVNRDWTRIIALLNIFGSHPKCIIFYNHSYELEILRDFCTDNGIPYAEWNGEKHEPIPEGDTWAYLLQYTAGCEAWNCTTTDTIIFYSQTYSYKQFTQAKGRIDRLDTPYVDLYYYILLTESPIDQAIKQAVQRKKKFNEKNFYEAASRKIPSV